jgi:hypothetical protein
VGVNGLEGDAILTFTRLGELGRLGNQMFQIASTIGIAKQNGHDYVFPSWPYAPVMKHPLPQGTVNAAEEIEEKGFAYSEYSLPRSGTFSLSGYFQSERYFDHCAGLVRSQFEPKDGLMKRLATLHDFSRSCSIHVRRGDYVGFQDVLPVLPMEYYEEAVRHLYGKKAGKVRFFIFSDDPQWCREAFHLKNSVVMKGSSDVMDLYLMSMCEDNIIANSSFSWWAAWLNGNRKKRVVAPRTWFGPCGPRSNSIVPDSWTAL